MKIFENIMEKFATLFIFVAIMFLVGFLYNYFTSEKIELLNKEWKCTNYKIETIYIVQNNIAVPTSNKVCTEYKILENE